MMINSKNMFTCVYACLCVRVRMSVHTVYSCIYIQCTLVYGIIVPTQSQCECAYVRLCSVPVYTCSRCNRTYTITVYVYPCSAPVHAYSMYNRTYLITVPDINTGTPQRCSVGGSRTARSGRSGRTRRTRRCPPLVVVKR